MSLIKETAKAAESRLCVITIEEMLKAGVMAAIIAEEFEQAIDTALRRLYGQLKAYVNANVAGANYSAAAIRKSQIEGLTEIYLELFARPLELDDEKETKTVAKEDEAPS